MILGCDAAGLDEDGNEVVVHSVISRDSWRADETLRPAAARCSPSSIPGTLARADSRSPTATSFASRKSSRSNRPACLPTAWLTAYRMLFTRCARGPGDDRARAGSRRRRRHRAHRPRERRRSARVGDGAERLTSASRRVRLGADQAFEAGARLPERVDVVMETVGEATLEPLDPLTEAGRNARGLGSDDRRCGSGGRADASVLPATVRDRIDDGDPRRVERLGPVLRREGHPPTDRPHDAACRRSRRVSGAAERRGNGQARLHRLHPAAAGDLISSPATPGVDWA